ncbi:hypothetical protein [Streptomyces sp. NPDC057052]|uniref:hypothetical protein n=1 Tax=Streptomyces sp. NPDC057052 TaxID=3346010 RepID=UPI00362B9A85
MTGRVLACPRCRDAADVVVDGTVHDVWGAAVIDDDGVVRPVAKKAEVWGGEEIRIRAVCTNDDCRHQWTLRRRFETPTAP